MFANVPGLVWSESDADRFHQTIFFAGRVLARESWFLADWLEPVACVCGKRPELEQEGMWAFGTLVS